MLELEVDFSDCVWSDDVDKLLDAGVSEGEARPDRASLAILKTTR